MLLRLTFAEVEIHPEQRLVQTRFSDGLVALATRADTDENQREAEDEGYSGDEKVWRCLIDHEILHSLCSEWLWQSASPTLRHVAGGERCEFGRQLGEEAIVISFQRWLNTRDIWEPLAHYVERLPRWRQRFEMAMARLDELPRLLSA